MSLRFLILWASLIAIILLLLTFLTGPIWLLPLDYQKGEQFQLIQICVPPFLAYIAAGVAYARAGRPFPEPEGERGAILRLICVGGLVIFAIGFVVATIIFYKTGHGQLPTGGLSYAQYSSLVTLLVSVLAVTTASISAFVFATPQPR